MHHEVVCAEARLANNTFDHIIHSLVYGTQNASSKYDAIHDGEQQSINTAHTLYFIKRPTVQNVVQCNTASPH